MWISLWPQTKEIPFLESLCFWIWDRPCFCSLAAKLWSKLVLIWEQLISFFFFNFCFVLGYSQLAVLFVVVSGEQWRIQPYVYIYLFSLKPRSALDLALLDATQGPLPFGTSPAAKTDSAFHLPETVTGVRYYCWGGKAEHVPESHVIGMKMTAGRVFYIFFPKGEPVDSKKKTNSFSPSNPVLQKGGNVWQKESNRLRGDHVSKNGWTGEWWTFLKLTWMLSQNVALSGKGAFTWCKRAVIAQN